MESNANQSPAVPPPEVQPKSKKWRSFLVNLLLFAVLVTGIRLWQQRDMVSGAAPELQGVTLSGQPYRLAAHTGRPVLVHFWATWCPICRAEQSSIAAIAADDPEVITVAMQSGKPEQVAGFMREQGISFAVLNDPDGKISAEWGVHAVPASFIVAPDGKIRFVEVGYTTGWGIRIRKWLAGI